MRAGRPKMRAIEKGKRSRFTNKMNPVLKLDLETTAWPVDGDFTISRGSRLVAEAIKIVLVKGGHRGQAECVPYARYGETLISVERQIRATVDKMGAHANRTRLQDMLPAGAARNALDCALWDLEAKEKGTSVAELLGLERREWVETAFTLSLGTPEKMHARAVEHQDKSLLKLKLSGAGDLERVAAVRSGAPETRIIVDANESWTVSDYLELTPRLQELGVSLIEQPFPADADEQLSSLPHAIPVCADESCHTRADLPRLTGLYDMINIKLDKAGGLTEGVALLKEAKARGFSIMVGSMLGDSLAIAPARLLAPYADISDLDGPLLLAADHQPPIPFKGNMIGEADPMLWG